MSRSKIISIGLCMGLGAAAAPADWSLNKDIFNTSGVVGAAGIKVELCGPATVAGTYDGYSDGHFGSMQQGTSADGNTTLTWSNLSDSDGNGTVDPNQLVHVGWTLTENVCIKSMYFVDAAGNPIPGGTIENTTPLVEISAAGTNITWGSNSDSPVDLTNIRINPFWQGEPGIVFPLAELNMFNPVLNDMLLPWVSGPITLFPDQQFTLQLPFVPAPTQPLLLAVSMTGPNSATFAIDFMQLTATGAPGCPRPGCDLADRDADCQVGLGDLSIVLGQFGLSGTGLTGDANGDGHVNLMDLSIVLANFGIDCR